MQNAAIKSLVERYQGKPTLDVDVFQVSHHGAENGTTAELLEALTPQIAVSLEGSRLPAGQAFADCDGSRVAAGQVVDSRQGTAPSNACLSATR